MRKELPEAFQRKIVIDALVLQEAGRIVVDFEEYIKLKKQQRIVFQQCANHGKK